MVTSSKHITILSFPTPSNTVLEVEAPNVNTAKVEFSSSPKICYFLYTLILLFLYAMPHSSTLPEGALCIVKLNSDFRKWISKFSVERLPYQLIAHHIDRKNEN